jgi:hypothetical protein
VSSHQWFLSVCQRSGIESKSQLQFLCQRLQIVCQRSGIESKSQLISNAGARHRSFYQSVKDQELKANHNVNRTLTRQMVFLSVCQRSGIESKSQPQHPIPLTEKWLRFYQSVKDQELKANHNCAGMLSAKEVLENSINVAEMNSLLLQKIEESTLYIVELNKKIDRLESRLKNLEAEQK